MRHARAFARLLPVLAAGVLLSAAVPAAAQPAPVQIEQLLGPWGRDTPPSLGADSTGPFWARRTSSEVLLERYAGGRIQSLNRTTAKVGHPAHFFAPPPSCSSAATSRWPPAAAPR
jgi:hypothetical protein